MYRKEGAWKDCPALKKWRRPCRTEVEGSLRLRAKNLAQTSCQNVCRSS